MSYSTGEGTTIYDLIERVDESARAAGWKAHRKEFTPDNRLSHVILEGVGDGTDKIFIQLRTDNKNFRKIFLDGLSGYDELLFTWEQPGSIQQWSKCSSEDNLVIQPTFTISYNEKFYYWIFVNNHRIIIVVRLGIIYESAHLGLLNPISSERQYPYPMYIAGNTTSKGTEWTPTANEQSLIYTRDGSSFLKRADGAWLDGHLMVNSETDENEYKFSIFPYNSGNRKLIPNYREIDAIDQVNFLLIPAIICSRKPVDLYGMIRDVYWISGTRDLDAERILVLDNDKYIVFDTKKVRGENTYFAIKME